MLDERLITKEDGELSSEDVYDIGIIFNSVDECIKTLSSKLNKKYEEILNDFNEEKSYHCGLDSYYVVYDKYVVFSTGRVAEVEFY
ncbi:TPA: hypothetical protein ACXDAY_002206 [Clostridium botulinum]|uniref:hypothetical protein n=1 Tax=Clostridium botulinum TaxID=1491 RepID=UPI000463574C|nr:hypothetical protein [Clostridium botulinum]APR02468.1 hypothetical protein RSJ2_3979 [Clostridium botulinum]AUN01513.1 hypothetical protein RSJ19_00590 [Clostridium botulinum]MBN3359229.1 hypothetical protein [Clostridium botulinum]QDY27077.1 hypothetical protein CGQ40_20445 [Clostridium botulinum]